MVSNEKLQPPHFVPSSFSFLFFNENSLFLFSPLTQWKLHFPLIFPSFFYPSTFHPTNYQTQHSSHTQRVQLHAQSSLCDLVIALVGLFRASQQSWVWKNKHLHFNCWAGTTLIIKWSTSYAKIAVVIGPFD